MRKINSKEAFLDSEKMLLRGGTIRKDNLGHFHSSFSVGLCTLCGADQRSHINRTTKLGREITGTRRDGGVLSLMWGDEMRCCIRYVRIKSCDAC